LPDAQLAFRTVALLEHTQQNFRKFGWPDTPPLDPASPTFPSRQATFSLSKAISFPMFLASENVRFW
jgi:hypothetical protein